MPPPIDLFIPITAAIRSSLSHYLVVAAGMIPVMGSLRIMEQAASGRRAGWVVGAALIPLALGAAVAVSGFCQLGRPTDDGNGWPDLARSAPPLGLVAIAACAFILLMEMARMARLTRRAPCDPAAKRTPRISAADQKLFKEFKAGLVGQRGENTVQQALARTERSALHDVLLRDAAGLTQIDHLVLADDAILVLETKTYGGLITGSPHAEQWVQHLQGGAMKTPFQNPLRQNFRHVAAVSSVLQRAGIIVPVRGHVISAGRAQYAGELSAVVVPVTDLDRVLRSRPVDRKAWRLLSDAWMVLHVTAAQNNHRREEHRAALAARPRATTPRGV